MKKDRKSFRFAEGTIYKRANSNYWYVYAPLLAGKMLRQSTGIPISDDDSLEQARLFLANLRQSKSHLAKPTRKEEAYKKALNLIAEDCGYTPTRLSIKDAIAKYTQSIKATAGTIRIYNEALSKFSNYFGSKTFIDTINIKQIEEFRTNLLTKYSYDTTKNTINYIKVFFNFLIHNELIDDNPLKLISRFKNTEEQQKKMRIFTKEEINLLLDYTKGTYWNPAIMLGLYTGQRLYDIFSLNWNQIDLENNTIHFHIQKTKKDFAVYIHPHLKNYLLSIPDKTGKLCKIDKIQAVLSKEFHKILIKLNIIEQPPKGKGKRKLRADLTYHSLRKTLNSWLASSGISPEIRSKIIGNTKEINQRHYTSIQDDAVISAINNLDI